VLFTCFSPPEEILQLGDFLLCFVKMLDVFGSILYVFNFNINEKKGER